MKGKTVLEMSHEFWDSFKLASQGKLTWNEVKKSFMNVDDAIAYRQFCNPRFNVKSSLTGIINRNFDVFVDRLLSELGKLEKKEREVLMRKALLSFLGNYSCYVTGEIKRMVKDIMLYFSSSFEAMSRNDCLDHSTQQMISAISSSMTIVQDKGLIIDSTLVKILSLYICLSSDNKGTQKCTDLCLKISKFKTWSNSTPRRITIPYLRKKWKNIDNQELIEIYSF